MNMNNFTLIWSSRDINLATSCRPFSSRTRFLPWHNDQWM